MQGLEDKREGEKLVPLVMGERLQVCTGTKYTLRLKLYIKTFPYIKFSCEFTKQLKQITKGAELKKAFSKIKKD
jgi:hypothetical protein